MSAYAYSHDDEGLARGGRCNRCGDQVDADHHAFCRRCFAAIRGWQEQRPDRRTPPTSFVEGLAMTRDQIAALTRYVLALEARLEALERRRAA